MKKVFKVTIILIILMISFGQVNNVYAAYDQGGAGGGSSSSSTKDVLDIDPNEYNPNKQSIVTGEEPLKKRANIIVTVIRNVGIVVAVIALMIIGFKEMTASIEQKSEIKQAMPGYLIGIVMVVAVSFLPTIIYQFMKNF